MLFLLGLSQAWPLLDVSGLQGATAGRLVCFSLSWLRHMLPSQAPAAPLHCRVRPDGEMQYDGASITPYETMFVPMDAGKVEAKWTYIRTALKYQEWMQAQVGSPGFLTGGGVRGKNEHTWHLVSNRERRFLKMQAVSGLGRAICRLLCNPGRARPARA